MERHWCKMQNYFLFNYSTMLLSVPEKNDVKAQFPISGCVQSKVLLLCQDNLDAFKSTQGQMSMSSNDHTHNISMTHWRILKNQAGSWHTNNGFHLNFFTKGMWLTFLTTSLDWLKMVRPSNGHGWEGIGFRGKARGTWKYEGALTSSTITH